MWLDTKKSLGCVYCSHLNNGGSLIEDWEWRLIHTHERPLENLEVDKADLFLMFTNISEHVRILVHQIKKPRVNVYHPTNELISTNTDNLVVFQTCLSLFLQIYKMIVSSL